jgi:hypothetical protein
MDIDEDVPTTRPWRRAFGLIRALAVLLGVPGFIFVIVTYCMILHYDLTHRQMTFAAGDEPDDTDAICGPVGPSRTTPTPASPMPGPGNCRRAGRSM